MKTFFFLASPFLWMSLMVFICYVSQWCDVTYFSHSSVQTNVMYFSCSSLWTNLMAQLLRICNFFFQGTSHYKYNVEKFTCTGIWFSSYLGVHASITVLLVQTLSFPLHCSSFDWLHMSNCRLFFKWLSSLLSTFVERTSCVWIMKLSSMQRKSKIPSSLTHLFFVR